jgi:hypothetical protein
MDYLTGRVSHHAMYRCAFALELVDELDCFYCCDAASNADDDDLAFQTSHVRATDAF